MQRCTKCGRTLADDEFAWRDRGPGKRGSSCKDCARSYRIAWYEKNAAVQKAAVQARRSDRRTINNAIVAAAKDRPCVDCGSRFPPEAMDFDHVGPAKRWNIGTAKTYVSEAELRAEIAVCEVVCANCHRVRTAARAGRAVGR